MAERIFGLETEYALTAFDRDGQPMSTWSVVPGLMTRAKRRPHLLGMRSGGVFLENGCRFYIDTGCHPEMTTPEVLTPWDACRYVLCGERLLARFAAEMVAEDRAMRRVFLTSCNVSYGEDATTWACHESYGHRANLDTLPDRLIPHLVSRVIFTGAGGFDNRSPGIEFMLSPRVAHLRRVISASSTEERGIFHWKDESLAGEGYHRLHILAGESLCSHEAMWLKVATTALVVAMIEARLLGDDFPLLRNPLGAIRRFARDPECKARAMGARDGRYWTAVRIQRAYLEAAEAHLDHPVMPAWAPQACARWRAMLDRLEQGAAGVCTTLDWAIKLELFRRQVKRQGLAWESIPVWNQALVSLERARRRCPRSARPRTLDVNLLAARSPVAGEVAEIGKFLQQHQLSWDQFEAVLAVRHKLFEIDARYGELGGQGIFASLDRAGVLAHRVEGVDRIEEAMVAPPAGCRATLRGQCIRRFYRDRLNYCCDWDGVWDFRTTRFLDLSDPFQREEQWTALWEPEPPYHLMEAAFDVDSQAQDLFRRGELAEARPLADMVRAYRGPVDGGFHEHAASIAARIHARLGLLDGAAILDEFRGRRDTLEGILDYVEVFRFRGLAPAPEAYTWMGRGLDLLAAQPEEPKGYLAAACCENQAYLLAAKGRLDVARRLLEDLCKEEEPIEPTLPLLARARAVLGEILRRMGLLVEAREQLDQARQLQEENGLLGDLAAFTLTALAKLPGDQSAALERLGRAKELQVRQGDPVGEARTLLLEARLCTERRRLPAIRERLEELGRTVPALGCCPLFTSLMSRWDEWTARRHEPDSRGDPFWGL